MASRADAAGGFAETDNQLNEEQEEDQEQYRNVRVLQALDTPTLRLCDKLRELEPCGDSSVKVGAPAWGL